MGEADPTPEADAKPDAGLLYGGYGLGYAYPLATAYYGLGYYGKRSADADAGIYGGYRGFGGYHGYGGYGGYYGGYYGKRSADADAGIYGGYRGFGGYHDTEDMVVTMEAIMARDLLMLMLEFMVGTEALEDIMDTEDMVATMEVTMVRDLLMLRLMPASMVGIEVSEDIMDLEDTEDTIMDEKY